MIKRHHTLIGALIGIVLYEFYHRSKAPNGAAG